MAENNTGETLLAFALGALAGAALGVIFAPASGKETRERIEDWAKEKREKGEGFLRDQKDLLAGKKEALAAALEAGKKAYRETSQG